MKQKLIDFAKSIEIEMIGFSKYTYDEKLKEKHQQKFTLHYDVPLNYKPDDVADLIKILPNVNTIITIALPYYKSCQYLDNITDEDVYFSSSSWGTDYHMVLNRKLDQIVEFLKSENIDFDYVKCVDTKPIDDRYYAYKAGIGFYGKNGLIINPKYGSYIFIGNLLTNLDFEPDEIINKSCCNCRKCIENCPALAINDNGIDSRKCLSYLTQKKEELTFEEKKLFNQCIYGCDVCMSVCPYNENNYEGYHEFKPTGIEFINVDTFEKMTNREFKNKYGHLAGSWRGKKIIERNIKIYQEKIDNKNRMC